MAYVSKITDDTNTTYNIKSYKTAAIPYGQVDSSSTSTVFTATVDGITALYDGVMFMLKNGVVTSAAGFTVNINGLGAKKCYSNMAYGTQDTTIFNINYEMLFMYESSLDSGNGGFIIYRGYDANTNTIGYQLRTNSALRPAADKGYKYRLWFQTLDGKWAPANTSSSTNATSSRTPNTRIIDPFGEIIYYSINGTTNADANLSAAACWQQYTVTLGYSFNTAGAALTLTNPAPVYLKCTPQTGGGVKMDGYVQALPSTADGKVYIFLGMAYSATAIELFPVHPVYYYYDGAIRLWTNAAAGSSVSPYTSTPAMDGTASAGSSNDYARGDHVHPTDTSRAAATHDHGSVTSAGAITSDTSAASGDKLIIADSSDSSKLKRSGIAFGSDTTKYLRNDGTWDAPASGGGATVTTASVTIAASDWSNNACTKTVQGVTASNHVVVTYAPTSKSDYTAADIYCTAQGSNTLTFACSTTPSSSITVNVLIITEGTV